MLSFLLPATKTTHEQQYSQVSGSEKTGERKVMWPRGAARVSKRSPPLSAGRSAKNSSLSPRELICFHVHHQILGCRVPGVRLAERAQKRWCSSKEGVL